MLTMNHKHLSPEKRGQQTQRVLNNLNARVAHDGTFLPNRGEHGVCIVHPNLSVCNSDVETFIRAHITQLPAKVRVLYGGTFPQFQDDGKRLLDLPFGLKLKRVIAKKLFKLSEETLRDQAFIRFIKLNNIQAVLAEYGPTGAAICDVCNEAGVPLIVHFHGYDAYEYKALERFKEGYQKIFKNASALIAVSKDMEKQLIGLGAPKEKVHLNSYGIDLGKFSGGDPAKTPATFVAVGRFVDKKAPHLTIHAFHKVWQKHPEARLIMIGEGELWETCKQLSSSLGLNGAVEFRGKCSSEQVADAMKNARAFVQHSLRPSSGDSEGTPVGILEAGASGLPVVSTRHAGIKDAVAEGKTGFLVDEGDMDGMSDRMLRLCEDPSLARKLGRAAKELIRTHYSMDKSISNLWRIIKKTSLAGYHG